MARESIHYIVDGKEIYPCYRICADNGRNKSLFVNEIKTWNYNGGYRTDFSAFLDELRDSGYENRFPQIFDLSKHLREGIVLSKFGSSTSHFFYQEFDRSSETEVTNYGYECTLLIKPQEFNFHLEYFKTKLFRHLLKNSDMGTKVAGKVHPIVLYDRVTLKYDWGSNIIRYVYNSVIPNGTGEYREENKISFNEDRVRAVQEYWKVYNDLVQEHAHDLIEYAL